MAWKVKPSGSMSIPRRDEPWVTEEMAAHIRNELMPRYAEPMGALMPSLHAGVEHHVVFTGDRDHFAALAHIPGKRFFFQNVFSRIFMIGLLIKSLPYFK